LIRANKIVRKNLISYNIRMTSSMAQQQVLVNGGGVLFLGELNSLEILYPFASADML